MYLAHRFIRIISKFNPVREADQMHLAHRFIGGNVEQMIKSRRNGCIF
jgi:hypothetical protein